MKPFLFLIAVWLLALFCPCDFQSMAGAQEALTAEVKTALAEITEKDVTATVAFLASDALAGRQTPSPELDIAAQYIAARFQAAGLVGGAKAADGVGKSYFQLHELATVSYNVEQVAITSDGQGLTNYGMLSAGSEPFNFNGNLTFVSQSDNWKKMTFNGPVCLEPIAITGPRDQFEILAAAHGIKQRGATAVLIQVDQNNQLVAEAEMAQSPSIVNPRMRWPAPTVLIGRIPADKNRQFDIALPGQITSNTSVKNVIGVLPGSDPELSGEAIIFSAHLDHIGRAVGNDTVNNGADDNASGCTAVCELADAYGALATRPKRTLIFMTFWGEEKGLLGSLHYANNPEWPLEKTVANINIEMVGRPEAGAHGKAWMTGWHQSDLGELMNAASAKVDMRIFEHPKFSAMLYRQSDNASFVDKGVVAHSFSAGSLHADYHQPTDHWEKLDRRHMTKVIQGLFVGSLPLANGDVTPAPSANRAQRRRNR